MTKIKHLLSDPDILVQMLAYKRLEEKGRIGSDLAEKPFSEFGLFEYIGEDAILEEQFMRMQEIYIFDDKYKLTYDEMLDRIYSLNDVLLELDEGLEQKSFYSDHVLKKLRAADYPLPCCNL